MKILVIGGSGKIGKSLNFKNTKKTFFKTKIKDGIKFDLIKDDVNFLLEKFNINRVILLSAISDPDICLKKKYYSNKVNVEKTKKLIDVLIKKKFTLFFFLQSMFLMVKKVIIQKIVKYHPIIFTGNKNF